MIGVWKPSLSSSKREDPALCLDTLLALTTSVSVSGSISPKICSYCEVLVVFNGSEMARFWLRRLGSDGVRGGGRYVAWLSGGLEVGEEEAMVLLSSRDMTHWIINAENRTGNWLVGWLLKVCYLDLSRTSRPGDTCSPLYAARVEACLNSK